MSMHVRAFLPTQEKVRQVEFHPVQPWIATATKDEHVCVWDWHSQQVICVASSLIASVRPASAGVSTSMHHTVMEPRCSEEAQS